MAVKTIKLSEDGKAGIQIEQNTVSLVATDAAGDAVGIRADETGVYIKGPLSIMTSPSQIRVGSFWVQNSPWRQMLPSSIAFPNPVLKMNMPMKGFEDLIQTVQWFSSLLV